MSLIFRVTGIWVLCSLCFLAGGMLTGYCMSLGEKLKVKLGGPDGGNALPLFDRRRKQRRAFGLRMTRRSLTLQEGRELERLHHAIDYLIETYSLTPDRIGELAYTARIEAVQLLLACRAKMLSSKPPLAALGTLLQQKLYARLRAGVVVERGSRL